MDVVNLGTARRFLRDKPIRVNLFDRPRVVCDLICLEAEQQDVRRPLSSSDEFYLVIEGRALLRSQIDVQELETLDAVLVPPGVEHTIQNPGPGQLSLLVLVTPKPARAGEVHMPAQGRPGRDARPPRRDMDSRPPRAPRLRRRDDEGPDIDPRPARQRFADSGGEPAGRPYRAPTPRGAGPRGGAGQRFRTGARTEAGDERRPSRPAGPRTGGPRPGTSSRFGDSPRSRDEGETGRSTRGRSSYGAPRTQGGRPPATGPRARTRTDSAERPARRPAAGAGRGRPPAAGGAPNRSAAGRSGRPAPDRSGPKTSRRPSTR